MSCNKCNEDNSKNITRSTHRTDDQKKELTRRLNIIEGQIRGINQMVADDRYCDDVLIQIAAATNALKSIGNNILEAHLKSCVAKDIKEGKMDILDEVMTLIKKLQ